MIHNKQTLSEFYQTTSSPPPLSLCLSLPHTQGFTPLSAIPASLTTFLWNNNAETYKKRKIFLCVYRQNQPTKYCIMIVCVVHQRVVSALSTRVLWKTITSYLVKNHYENKSWRTLHNYVSCDTTWQKWFLHLNILVYRYNIFSLMLNVRALKAKPENKVPLRISKRSNKQVISR